MGDNRLLFNLHLPRPFVDVTQQDPAQTNRPNAGGRLIEINQ